MKPCNCKDVRFCPGCPRDPLVWRIAQEIMEPVAIVVFVWTLLFWAGLIGSVVGW